MNNIPRLFCFTYAGGSAAFFDEIEKDLEGIELKKLEYAGHASRHKERFYQDFNELGDDLFQIIKGCLQGSYALFGYSMGSIALVEVLRRIIQEGMPLPIHVFLAAHEPRTKSELTGFAPDEMDDWVKDRTIEFGAVPEQLLHNDVYWRTYLPLYRADYTLIGRYNFEKLEFHTEIPATFFYAEKDTPYSQMEAWKKYFTGRTDFCGYDGTHFFIREHHREMAKVIKGRLCV